MVTLENGQEIQEWANQNEPGDEMIYKRGYWDQIVFIRDQIPCLFSSPQYDWEDIRKHIRVVSTHVSKSIKLPVFHVHLPEYNVTLIMRYNFHDWKISVSSKRPIDVDFMGLFKEDMEITSLYCEGFSNEWVYPPYEKNKQTFTIEISDHMKLFNFFWILNHHLKNRTQSEK